MSKINFCPRCATPLTSVFDGGRDRQACPDTDCGFVHFGDFSIGCSGVVLRTEAGVNKALLIQRGQEPFAGTWQLPGGYVENDELLSLAVEREIEEEAGVTAKVTDVVAFRHMLG
ncbi:MAG: NUDIX domain-containing protein, partial [Pseudomonadota bacterium]|nr:NUDIX domain-containing protein [Pseudomonadota bacterium]